MIKHKDLKEHGVYLLLILVGFVFLAKTYAASTIGTNIQSDGNFILNSSTSTISFANGWKILQSNATTTEVRVTDSGDAAVIVFDEN